MSNQLRRTNAAAAAAIAFTAPATPAAAQQPPARPGVMGDLLRDVQQVQTKLIALAKAMPADKQDWRPAEGVRSVGQVWQHVSADNYLLPAAVGVAPDPATGIKAADYATVTAYETRKISRDESLAALEQSFAHLVKAMRETPDARLDEMVKFFGQDMTVRQVWIATTTHLHEHLGQAIAYARSNGVVPPWSRSGG